MNTQAIATLLGAYHWERLERLADHYGHKNRNEYAANLLKRAIEESEMWMRSDKYAHYERIIEELEAEQARLRAKYRRDAPSGSGEMDDDIPF